MNISEGNIYTVQYYLVEIEYYVKLAHVLEASVQCFDKDCKAAYYL